MMIPQVLADFVSMIRLCVERAHSIGLEIERRNTLSHLNNISYYVIKKEDLNNRILQVGYAATEYFNQVEAMGFRFHRNNPTAIQLRNGVLTAIRRLEEALENAEPSDEAKALGLDWT